MIPILYPRTETEFTNNGLGTLSDAISCRVEEELNDIYELTMEYPDNGIRADQIVEGNIIMATHDSTGDLQPLRIYSRTENLNGTCVINARHLSYDLSRIPVAPFTAGDTMSAMTAVEDNVIVETPFTFSSSFFSAGDFAVEVPQSVRAILGGGSGSIIDVYGGELEYDKWNVDLKLRRGQDKDYSIRYGVNMTGLEAVFERQEGYYKIVPFYRKQDTLIMCDPPIVEWRTTFSSLAGAMVVDLTDRFEEEPTAAELRTAAGDWLEKNKPWIVETAISIDFVQLEKTEDYKDLVRLQELQLGDGIMVYYKKPVAALDWNAPWLSWEAPFRLTRTNYDVLRDRYIDVTLGRKRETLSSLFEKQNLKFQKTANIVNWQARHA